MAWVTVFLLLLAYISSFVDRMILTLLINPIRADLAISDTEFGLLQGFAFALFYTLMGLPLGRLLDKHSRLRLITIGITIWSLMTAACGLAGRFSTLFLARIGVGVGEAVLTPGAYSVISDSFSKQRLGLAMGIYNLGAPIGGGIAMITGGYLIKYFEDIGQFSLPFIGIVAPWQMTFIAVGLPGLAIALALLMLREPPRQIVAQTSSDSIPLLSEVFGFWKTHKKTMITLHVAVAAATLSLNATFTWMVALFLRVHHWEIQEIGAGLGIALLIAGLIGMVGGGILGDWMIKKHPNTGRLRVSGYGVLFSVPFMVAFPLIDDASLAVIIFGFGFMGLTSIIGGAVAALTTITPSRMRGTVSAIYLLIVNMIGLTFGPLLVGLLNDYVFTSNIGVRYSLLVVVPLAALLSYFLFLMTRQPYRETLAIIQGKQ